MPDRRDLCLSGLPRNVYRQQAEHRVTSANTTTANLSTRVKDHDRSRLLPDASAWFVNVGVTVGLGI